MLIRDDADGIVVEVQAAMDSAPPTAAVPGSPEKVAVMEARALQGFSIFIPGDTK